MRRSSTPVIDPAALPAQNVYSHWFANIQRRHAETAAGRIPLVMWEDVMDGPGPQDVNFHHDFCSLYVVKRGTGLHVIEGTSYGVARGDVYAMGPGMRHHFERCRDLSTDTLHFSPAISDSETLSALAQTPGFYSLFVAEPLEREGERHTEAETRWLHLTPTQYALTRTAHAELAAEWNSSTPIGALLTRGLFLRLLVLLSRFYAENSRSAAVESGAEKALPVSARVVHAGPHEATIAAAVRYLEANFHRSIRIEQVAARVYLSPDRFTEVFSQALGRTPRDYLRHLRVEHAKRLLATTDLPMAAIAEASGFAEPAYFTRVIRDATGVTPSAFRRSAART